ncbi:MAG: putative L-lactate dehydrogenase operon regulatory protein [Burkholderia plantarii]|nr:MAG: putative L-lactate dehydrogenase operon regulatory protein [Burkholderia plantarii]
MSHPNEPRRLYQDIAERLRMLISDPSFTRNGRLPAERDLAKQLGVSRASVREALVVLEIEGRVEIRMGSGVYLSAPGAAEAASAASAAHAAAAAAGEAGAGAAAGSKRGGADATAPLARGAAASMGDSPLDVMRARSLIEGALAGSVAAHLRADELKKIRTAYEAMRAAVEAGESMLEADRLFHLRIAEASSNDVMVRIVNGLFDERHSPLHRKLGAHFENPETWAAALAEHREILEALEERDPIQAQAAMMRHLKASHQRLMKRLKG